ncbi:MAG: hypothetical protein M3083_01775 [Actinomycetota bacterium]|nr:hypothetical protein [Actinomycetota bacterium]
MLFLVAFDADPLPSIDHNFRDSRYPWGLVRVRDLGLTEHDGYSLASLRNELVKVDNIAQTSASVWRSWADPSC